MRCNVFLSRQSTRSNKALQADKAKLSRHWLAQKPRQFAFAAELVR